MEVTTMSSKFPTQEELAEQKAQKEQDSLAKTAAWAALMDKATASEVAGMLVDELVVLHDLAEDEKTGNESVVLEAKELVLRARGLLRLARL
jgi:hypothetical protein